MGWLDQFRCRCVVEKPVSNGLATYGQPKPEPAVSPTSPARILAASLTDPATAGEWEREWEGGSLTGNPLASSRMVYRNAARNIEVARCYGYGSAVVSSVFTLSEAEDRIVLKAMDAFDQRLKQTKEADALARLLAPTAPPDAQTDP